MVIQFTLNERQRDFNRLVRNDCTVCFDKLFAKVTGTVTKKEGKKLKITEERKVVEQGTV